MKAKFIVWTKVTENFEIFIDLFEYIGHNHIYLVKD